MGKIKEQRRKNRRKKLIKQAVAVSSLVLLVVVLTVVAFSLRDVPSEDIADSNTGEEMISSSDVVAGSEKGTEDTDATENTTQEESAQPEPEELRIVMVGDMLMHTRVVDSGLKEDGTYNFDHLFVNVKQFIQEADISIVNQETIMGGEEIGYSGYPRFNSPYELADAEVNAGFNVILHATNHTTDKGKEAVLNCMEYWDTNYPDIAYLGINKTQEEQDNNIYVFEQNGIKVAILNYTYTLNGNRMPSDMPYLVNLMTKGVSEEKIIADIKKAEEIADFTIVCPHWGTEYSLTVSSTQKYWTQIFLENGVDLVMGAHPHVIEPIEWVTDEEGHKMLVYYSLGNYVNGTSSTNGDLAQRMVGGIADVTIGRNESGEVEILANDVVPIVCHIGEGDTYTVYYLDDYTQEMAQENRIRLQDSEFSLDACWNVVYQVWGEE